MRGSPLLIGLGAGATSALLYAAAASGSPLALLLLYAAPLPILIAAAGWRHLAGLVATVFGAACLAVVVGPKTALYFTIAVGLPSWWLAYLALLARPGEGGVVEWYPPGRLVIWCAAIGALLVAASIPLVATSLEEYRAALRELFTKAFEARGGTPGLVPDADAKPLIELMTALAPSMAAGFWTASSLFNLWLAARIVRASGRLVRPWPDLRRIAFPNKAFIGLFGGFAGSLLPDLAGLVAELFAGTFLMAFALLGLAVVHVITQATPARGLILVAVYGMLVLQPWILLLLAGLGVAEQIFGVRRRFGGPPGGPPATATANLP